MKKNSRPNARKTSKRKPLKKAEPVNSKKEKDKRKGKKRTNNRLNDSKPSKPTAKPRKKRKKNHKTARKRKLKKEIIKEIALTLLIGGLLFFFGQLFIFSFPKMEGYGMSMTLSDGNRLYVNRLSSVRRFDVVYFKHPSTKELMIRRVIGLPGESLEYKEDVLFINDKIKPERFLGAMIAQAETDERLYTENFTLKQVTEESTVPKDCYFVLGDNRQYGLDSRDFGFINKSDIVGIVKMKLLPLHEMEKF